jgi:hypothetical protein
MPPTASAAAMPTALNVASRVLCGPGRGDALGLGDAVTDASAAGALPASTAPIASANLNDAASVDRPTNLPWADTPMPQTMRKEYRVIMAGGRKW